MKLSTGASDRDSDDRPARSASGYQRGEWSTKPDYTAECLTPGCSWTLSARNAQGPAAVHARKHKHCVRVEVETARIYNHEP